MSLFHLGVRQLTVDGLDAFATALRRLAMPAFLVGFDRIGSLGRTRGSLVLCGNDDSVVSVRMLRLEVAEALRTIGWRCNSPDDALPHVTLNYRTCSVPEEPVDEIRWKVSEIALVCSLRGRHQHVQLGRWPLRCDRA